MRSNFTRTALALVTFLTCLLFVLSGQTQNSQTQSTGTAEELFRAGVASFQKNQLDQAREQFSQSLKLDPENAQSLYNLGLVEFKAKNEGLALGLWRKALVLEPTNEVVAHAIEFGENALPQRSVSHGGDLFESFHESFLNRTSIMSLIVVNLALLAFAGWILIRYFALKNRSFENEEPSPPIPYIGFIFVIGLILSAAVLAAKVFDLTQTRATVTVEKVEVKTSPDEQAATLFELFEGLEVVVRQSRGDWMQITYPGGLSGWVQTSAVLVSSGRQP
jgi:tetratricopeptide (TPR) repeat protein